MKLWTTRRCGRSSFATTAGVVATSPVPIATSQANTPLRVAGADETLHRLLGQLERRARSAATHDLARLLIDDGQERVWIIFVELYVEIRTQPLPGLTRTRDRAMKTRSQRVVMPAQHVVGALQQRCEAGPIHRLGIHLVATHRPRAHEHRLRVADTGHRHRPALAVVVFDHACDPAGLLPVSYTHLRAHE